MITHFLFYKSYLKKKNNGLQAKLYETVSQSMICTAICFPFFFKNPEVEGAKALAL